MAATDSSTVIAYIQGDSGADVEKFDVALEMTDLLLPPAVLVEVLCHPNLPQAHAELLAQLPVLEISFGYWRRAAETRRKVLSRGLRAPLADALIAQSCIDYDVPLITRDNDFRHFAKHCGLRLA